MDRFVPGRAHRRRTPPRRQPVEAEAAALATKICQRKLKFGWGTWIRTKIDGVRVRSSTVELSPTGAPVRSGRAIECFV